MKNCCKETIKNIIMKIGIISGGLILAVFGFMFAYFSIEEGWLGGIIAGVIIMDIGLNSFNHRHKEADK